MFVYVIVCAESLKLYVGQHSGRDLGKYLSRKFYDAHRYLGLRSHLYAAMRKYSRNTWAIYPLVSGIETRAELDKLEKHFIRVLKTQHPDVGYNILAGGEIFWKRTENGTEKLRKAITASWKNPETRARRIQGIKAAPGPTRFKVGHEWNPKSGAKGPNETSFKTGIVPWNTGTVGKTTANSGSFVKGHKRGVGRKFSVAHIKHLRESHLGQKSPTKGIPHTAETRQKMRDAWIRRKARQAAL